MALQSLLGSIRNTLKNTRGVGLIVVMGLISTLFIFGSAMSTLVLQRVQLQQDFLRQLAELEMLESSFAALEVALERRRWEPPSDDGCLAREEFGAEITMSDGRVIEVTATYNPTTRQYWLRASVPSVAGGTVVATKAINTIDISDFLLLNLGPGETRISRGILDTNLPAGFIARDRRLQTRGRLVFDSTLARGPAANRSMDFTDPKPMRIPMDVGSVVQAERMVISGGIEYLRHNNYGIPRDDLSVYDVVRPHRLAGHFFQRSISPGIITRDVQLARALHNSVLNDEPLSPLDLAQARIAAYPIALFSDGNRPMDANAATDTGHYHGDPDEWIRFHYVDSSNIAHVTNGTCMSVGAASCSHSEAFPRGFNQWRSDAGLQGVLYTSDGEFVGRRPLDWDNFDSWREDADKCGLVITDSSGLPSYEDCDVSDLNLLERHRTNPGVNPCMRVFVLDGESLAGALPGFNPVDYSNPVLEERLLPRVVYSEVPLEISQSHDRGLMVGALPVNGPRGNLAINIISEERVVIRPVQFDLTSPLNVDPGRMREVHFNSDATDNDPSTFTEPIKLSIVSPEALQVSTPQYVPIDYPGLQEMLPVVAGQLAPVYHPPTDWRRQDGDGFLYGLRRLIIRNLAIVSNFSSGPIEDPPLYLKGLWSGRGSGVGNYISQACMYADPGDPTGVDGFYYDNPGFGIIWTPVPIPDYAKVADPNVPPPASPFYGGKDEVPEGYFPEVFNVQRRTGGLIHNSSVDISGVVLRPGFANQDIVGRRRLSQANHSYINPNSSYPWPRVNVNDRFVHLTGTPFWQDTTGPQSCGDGSVKYSSGTIYRFSLSGLSRGASVIVSSSPSDSFRRVGTLYHTDMPLISGE